jgi:hypothetical protein
MFGTILITTREHHPNLGSVLKEITGRGFKMGLIQDGDQKVVGLHGMASSAEKVDSAPYVGFVEGIRIKREDMNDIPKGTKVRVVRKQSRRQCR